MNETQIHETQVANVPAREVWRAAITLANNLCVQESDRINGDDGPLDVVHALNDLAKRIRGWIAPTPEQLYEMLAEAGALQQTGYAILDPNAPVAVKVPSVEPEGWGGTDSDKAYAEGWGIFDSGGVIEIQRIDDDNLFSDDEAARAYVSTQAEAGSELHQRALAVVASYAPEQNEIPHDTDPRCPQCDGPNQFGETCEQCRREAVEDNESKY